MTTRRMLSRLLVGALIAAPSLALAPGAARAQPMPPPGGPPLPPGFRPVPPPRFEPPPPPPPGAAFVWVPGHWHWNGDRYLWIRGHYIRRRPGWHHWRDGHWALINGAWRWVPGGWY